MPLIHTEAQGWYRQTTMTTVPYEGETCGYPSGPVISWPREDVNRVEALIREGHPDIQAIATIASERKGVRP